MRANTTLCRLLAAFWALSLFGPALAAPPEFVLTIRNHRFEPAELVMPAATKVRLKVVNADATPEEFESHPLNREKIIPGKSSAVIFVGPLKPGRYPFFGEFNASTAQGVLIVR